MTPHRYVIITQSPWFTLPFTLGETPKFLDEFIMTWTHHSIIIEVLPALRNLFEHRLFINRMGLTHVPHEVVKTKLCNEYKAVGEVDEVAQKRSSKPVKPKTVPGP